MEVSVNTRQKNRRLRSERRSSCLQFDQGRVKNVTVECGAQWTLEEIVVVIRVLVPESVVGIQVREQSSPRAQQRGSGCSDSVTAAAAQRGQESEEDG